MKWGVGGALWNEHVEIPHKGNGGRDQVWSYDWASWFMLQHRSPSNPNLSNPNAMNTERNLKKKKNHRNIFTSIIYSHMRKPLCHKRA